MQHQVRSSCCHLLQKQPSIDEHILGKQLQPQPMPQDLVSGSVLAGLELPAAANVAAIGSFAPGLIVVVGLADHPAPAAVGGTVEPAVVAFARSTCRWTKCSIVLIRRTNKTMFRYQRIPNAAGQRLHYQNKRMKIFGILFDQLLVLG